MEQSHATCGSLSSGVKFVASRPLDAAAPRFYWKSSANLDML
jgi:hypothetical protein